MRFSSRKKKNAIVTFIWNFARWISPLFPRKIILYPPQIGDLCYIFQELAHHISPTPNSTLWPIRKKEYSRKTKPNQYTRAWQINITLRLSCSPPLSSSGIHFVSPITFFHCVLTLILKAPSLSCSQSISPVGLHPFPSTDIHILTISDSLPSKVFLELLSPKLPH